MKATVLVLALAMAQAPFAYATLGKREQSIQKDQLALRGSRTQVTRNLYRVHEITNPTGLIREYVSNDGVVFAVTWRGVAEPNLSQLLGDYFQRYKTSRSPHRPSQRSPIRIRTDGLVVEKGGHMRDIRGRAYVPSLVPNGVDLKDVQ